MILHYLKIALRNISKYKTQTAISICAMAVSLTLLAIVTPIMLSVKPIPLLCQPYAERIEEFSYDGDLSRTVNPSDRELILGHHFKSVEEIHVNPAIGYGIMVTANSGSKDEHSLITYGMPCEKGFIKFNGVKSLYSGKTVGDLSEKEIVITDWLAKKLFEGENPIGKTVSIKIAYMGNNHPYDGNYIVKDVVHRGTSDNGFMSSYQHVYIGAEQFPGDVSFMYFLLKEGSTREELTKELNNLLPSGKVRLYNVKETYDNNKLLAIRNCVILFLFIFVLVTFANYMRQQAQLFRLREREIALRTCVGCVPSSLFCMFSTEIIIVLTITFIITLSLIYLIFGFLISNYDSMLEAVDYNISEAVKIAVIAISILFTFGLVTVVVSVRRIRNDQTGLALRMKPIPKHRLRNVGLVAQMTICILFTWITFMLFPAIDAVKNLYGIPDDVDRYERGIILTAQDVAEEDMDKIFEKIKALESVEYVYEYVDGLYQFNENDDFSNASSYYAELQQKNNDAEEFLNIKIKKMPGNVNPERNILISEGFKKMLIEKNLWNGKTVTLPNRYNGEYEIRGVFDKVPFKESYFDKAVIITDKLRTSNFDLKRIIIPKIGREREANDAIAEIIREVIPTRVDIKTDKFLSKAVPSYIMTIGIITIIYILSIISVVTTMASVYAGVSLDTRRRRKEMALRKLNGAGRKVIAMMFVRTYVGILGISALIALALGLILIPGVSYYISPTLSMANSIIPYVIAFVVIIAVTACTIAWKIRDIMHADPIEYLKE